MLRVTSFFVAWVVLAVSAGTAQALTIDLVTVGGPNNAADDTGYGSVSHTYQIGKHEVTAVQYAEFLNAVARTDTYNLYHEFMWTSDSGCKIQRTGSSGSYAYSVAGDRELRPVNYVSFWDACRFANWLHNGQPKGEQGPGTTETGAYTLNGYEGSDGREISRNPGARFWIPSEDEWYKAAYHKNDGPSGNYWEYPTRSEAPPTSELPPGTDMLNGSANYADYYDGGYVDPVYYTTEVAAYTARPSDSPYGTFDQGGNVEEWNDTLISTGVSMGEPFGARGLRGGHWWGGSPWLAASTRGSVQPALEGMVTGFRVASVPEPSAIALLSMGTLALLAYAWRKRRWR
jgi:sulfatase modifying factor 1